MEPLSLPFPTQLSRIPCLEVNFKYANELGYSGKGVVCKEQARDLIASFQNIDDGFCLSLAADKVYRTKEIRQISSRIRSSKFPVLG